MTVSKGLRKVQVMFVDHVDEGQEPDSIVGHWKNTEFHQLRNGDVFRLFDVDVHGNEVPDIITDEGHPQVCVALSDAKPTEEAPVTVKTADGKPVRDGVKNYYVQTEVLNGL